jgi:uncharacterized protein GlcG (DUF336 family)
MVLSATRPGAARIQQKERTAKMSNSPSHTVTKVGVSAAAAKSIVDAGIERATQLGIPVSVAVVDEVGELKAFARQDGASTSSIELAVDKAFTVVSLGFGVGTSELFELVKGDFPLLEGIPGRGRFALIGGGLPIKADGNVVGAVGVSGGHYSDDVKVAEAAADAFGGSAS